MKNIVKIATVFVLAGTAQLGAAATPAPAGFMDTLKGPQWLDTAKFPALTYTATRVVRIGAKKYASLAS